MHIRKLCYSACTSLSLLTGNLYSVLLIFREFWTEKSVQKHVLPSFQTRIILPEGKALRSRINPSRTSTQLPVPNLTGPVDSPKKIDSGRGKLNSGIWRQASYSTYIQVRLWDLNMYLATNASIHMHMCVYMHTCTDRQTDRHMHIYLQIMCLVWRQLQQGSSPVARGRTEPQNEHASKYVSHCQACCQIRQGGLPCWNYFIIPKFESELNSINVLSFA
jgi:hypothetical protein